MEARRVGRGDGPAGVEVRETGIDVGDETVEVEPAESTSIWMVGKSSTWAM